MRKSGSLTIVISAVVISIVYVVGLSSAYGEEVILVHLDSRTGDIRKVEHEPKPGVKRDMTERPFSEFEGIKERLSFQHSWQPFADKRSPALCCYSYILGWYACHEVVVARILYDSKQNELKFHSLHFLDKGDLKMVEQMPFDPSRKVALPMTRTYHLDVVDSSGGAAFQLIDESKKMVWRDDRMRAR